MKRQISKVLYWIWRKICGVLWFLIPKFVKRKLDAIIEQEFDNVVLDQFDYLGDLSLDELERILPYDSKMIEKSLERLKSQNKIEARDA